MRFYNIRVPFHIFTITGTKKIVCYTEDFVIYRGLLYRGSTVHAKYIGNSNKLIKEGFLISSLFWKKRNNSNVATD